MKTVIRDIAYHLPKNVVTNEDLQSENPGWDVQRLQQHTGIYQRYIADPSETALDLALVACRKLFQRYPELLPSIDGIIFCTQSPDYIMPPNACVLHKHLSLKDEVWAFDINLACSGFIYGLAIASGLMHIKATNHILLVTADTYSKYIYPKDHSTRMVFSDAAAVTYLAASTQKNIGIRDILCATQGKDFDSFYIPAGGSRMLRSERTQAEVKDDYGNIRTAEHIQMDGMRLLEFIMKKLPAQIESLLKRQRLGIDDIDLFVFHQANRFILDALARRLHIPQEKMFKNLKVGNTVSASIPIALAEAQEQGLLKQGQRVLLSGFGVGLSWGTAIVEF